MNSALYLICEILLLCTSFVLPLGLTSFYAVRKNQGWKPVAWGMAALVVVQLSLRLVLLQGLFHLPGFDAFSAGQPVLYSLLLSLCMGFFQCALYWAVMRLLLRRPLRQKDALGFGLGYAMMHAMLFAGVNTLNALLAGAAQNTALWPQVLGSALEQGSMFVLQVLLALWIAKGIQKGKPLYFLTGFLFISLVLFAGTLINAVFKVSSLWLGLFLAVTAAITGWMLFPRLLEKGTLAKEED